MSDIYTRVQTALDPRRGPSQQGTPFNPFEKGGRRFADEYEKGALKSSALAEKERQSAALAQGRAMEAAARVDPVDVEIKNINERRANVRMMKAGVENTLNEFLAKEAPDLFEVDPVSKKPIKGPDGEYVPALGRTIEGLRAKATRKVGTIMGALSPSKQAGDLTGEAREAQKQLAELEPVWRQKQEKYDRIVAERKRLELADIAHENRLAELAAAREARFAQPGAGQQQFETPQQALDRIHGPLGTPAAGPGAVAPQGADPTPAAANTPAAMVKLHAQIRKAEEVGDQQTAAALRQQLQAGMGQLDETKRQRVVKATKDPSFWEEFGRNAADAALSFGSGTGATVKMLGDIYGLATGNMDNPVSRYGQTMQDVYNPWKSEEFRALEENRAKAVEAEADVLGKAWAYVRETVANPTLLTNLVAEQVSNMVPGGIVGAGARVAATKALLRNVTTEAAAKVAAKQAAKIGVGTAVGAGAAMQGADVGSDQYDDFVASLEAMPAAQAAQIPEISALMERGATLDEAKVALALFQARKTALLAGGVSIAAQNLPGGATLEKALVGGATKQVAGGLAKNLAGRAAAGAAGMVGEGVSEVVEEAGGQIVKNVEARPVDPDRPIMEGVGETIGQAALVGGVMGGAAGAANVETQRQQPPSPQTPSTPQPQPQGGDPNGQEVQGQGPQVTPPAAPPAGTVPPAAPTAPTPPAKDPDAYPTLDDQEVKTFEVTNAAGKTVTVQAVRESQVMGQLPGDFGDVASIKRVATPPPAEPSTPAPTSIQSGNAPAPAGAGGVGPAPASPTPEQAQALQERLTYLDEQLAAREITKEEHAQYVAEAKAQFGATTTRGPESGAGSAPIPGSGSETPPAPAPKPPAAPAAKPAAQPPKPAGPAIARGSNKPQTFVSTVSKIAKLKAKDKATRVLADLAPRLHNANRQEFENMEVHVLTQAEWNADERTNARTPDSAAAYNPETNTLYLNSDKLNGQDGVDLVSAIVHESGHFAERFALGEALTDREWRKLTHEQRVEARREYDGTDMGADPVALLSDKRSRAEWVAMQFARVIRGETDQMPKTIVEKLKAHLKMVRDLVQKWVGTKSLTTAELDSWILDKMGYAKRSEQRRVIGKNAAGLDLEEDADGVRSFVRDGVRQTESVRLTPTPAGIQKSIDPANRSSDFKTVDEMPKAPAAPTPLKRGDNLRLMEVDGSVNEVREIDGVEYLLLRGPANKEGVVRVMDKDSGNVVSLTKYPTFAAASAAYQNLIQKAEKPAAMPKKAPDVDPETLADVKRQLADMQRERDSEEFLERHKDKRIQAQTVLANDSGKLADDVRRGRISADDALSLIADAKKTGLLPESQAAYMRSRVQDAAPAPTTPAAGEPAPKPPAPSIPPVEQPAPPTAEQPKPKVFRVGDTVKWVDWMTKATRTGKIINVDFNEFTGKPFYLTEAGNTVEHDKASLLEEGGAKPTEPPPESAPEPPAPPPAAPPTKPLPPPAPAPKPAKKKPSDELRKAIDDLFGTPPSIEDTVTPEELQGKTVTLDSIAANGKKVTADWNAVEAWTDTNQRIAVYEKLRDCVKGRAA